MPFDLQAYVASHQTLWDNQESVTFTYIRTSGNTTATASALRRAVTATDEMSFGSAKVYRENTTFHTAATLATAPLIADTITDASSRVWNIIEVGLESLETRYRLACRRWVLGEMVTIHRAQQRQAVDGSKTVTWPSTETVSAGIQPESSFQDDDAGRRMFNTRYRVLLASNIVFRAGDKIVDADGNTYFVIEWAGDERVDDLQVVICDRTP